MKKKTIVLFEPLSGILSNNYRVIPLSLLSISRFINYNKFDIIIIDQKISNWKSKLDFVLSRSQVFMFGFTAMTGYQLYFASLIAKYVRKKRPDISIVFGGSHATSLPKQLLLESYVDYVIIGDGEQSFPKLVDVIDEVLNKGITPNYSVDSSLVDKVFDKVERKKLINRLSKIKGIGYLVNSKVLLNPIDLVDYSELSDPPYDLIDINNYNYVKEEKEFYIEGSKGCIFRCTFCHNQIYGGKWRARNAEKIIENMIHVQKKYGISKFFIIDDSFLIDFSRVYKFLDLIEKNNLKIEWSIEANLVHLSKLDNTLLKQMYNLGLRWISVGVESGSRKIRSFFKKPVDISSLLRFNKVISKYPINVRYNFMSGAPVETRRDVRQTLILIKNLLKNPYAMIQPLYITVPFPKTEYEQQIKKFGYIIPSQTKDWFDYDPFSIKNKLPWLRSIKGKMSEFLMYESFFIDKKMEFYFSSNSFYHKFMRALIKLYRPIARFRFFNCLFFIFPEKYIFKFLFFIERKRTINRMKKLISR